MNKTLTGHTHKAVIHGENGRTKFFFTVNTDENGRPVELFMHMDQDGSTLDGLCNCVGILWSMCLQAGVPMQAVCERMAVQRFLPNGWTECAEVRQVSSVVDYVARWMMGRFGGGEIADR